MLIMTNTSTMSAHANSRWNISENDEVIIFRSLFIISPSLWSNNFDRNTKSKLQTNNVGYIGLGSMLHCKDLILIFAFII